MDFDEFKEVMKEQWDVALYVVMIGLILGWALYMTILLPMM